MRKAFLFIALFPLCAAAQQDDWDAYMMQYEKGPGSTLINMAAKDKAPAQSLPFLLITGVAFGNCTGEGLPAAAEFSKLYIVSDSILSIVEHKTKTNLLVGTFSYQCQRLDYYYVNDTANIRQELTAMYKNNFPAYQPVVTIKADSSWSTYLGFLYPKEEVIEYMKDQKAVMKLKETGDAQDKARQIDHWLHFPTETNRKCIFNYLADNKFIVESMDKTDRPGYPFSLHISRVDKTEIGTISKISKALNLQAKNCNGIYGGWESAVVK